MSSVYYKASKVIAYLGEPHRGNDATLHLLTTLDLDKTHDDLCHEGFRHLLLSLQLLLQAPWFTRTWVRQEVFMANSLEVQIGFVSLAWKVFVAQATALLKQGKSIFRPTTIPRNDSSSKHDSDEEDPHDYWSLTQVPASLELLYQGDAEDKARIVLGPIHDSQYHVRDLAVALRGSNHFEASDSRDFVYGVASMTTAKFNHPYSSSHSRWSQEASIKIDYQLSLKSVYEDTTLYLMQTARCLEPMFFAHSTRRQSSPEGELASWCPNWSLLPTRTVLDVVWTAMEEGDSFNFPSMYIDFGSSYNPAPKSRTALHADRIAFRNGQAECPKLRAPGGLVCNGLILGHIHNRIADGPEEEEWLDAGSKQEWRTKYVPVSIEPLVTPEVRKGELGPVNLFATFEPDNMRHFRLSGPSSWQEGDVVAYIRSSSLPAVLRPTANIGSYHLVGPLISSAWVNNYVGTYMEVYRKGHPFVASMHDALMHSYKEDRTMQELVLI
ncbi:MAG: hypothetical protein Q9168_007450 [Polycauliona sp. 1 TL-2023]